MNQLERCLLRKTSLNLIETKNGDFSGIFEIAGYLRVSRVPFIIWRSFSSVSGEIHNNKIAKETENIYFVALVRSNWKKRSAGISYPCPYILPPEIFRYEIYIFDSANACFEQTFLNISLALCFSSELLTDTNMRT